MSSIRTSTGHPYPLGATVDHDGINFALFSRHATRVFLELFHEAEDPRPAVSLELDPERNRTGDVWHVLVHGVGAGQLYGYRAEGPYLPAEEGHRFNVNKLLSDPYARALVGAYDMNHDSLYGYDRSSPDADLSFSSSDSAPHTVKSMALRTGGYDWEDDRPPRRATNDSVIYEMHVKGFTVHPSSAVAHPGTYLGVVEKIPHLLELGVTAVELLPVHEFNEGEPTGLDPVTGNALTNFWGYQTLGFFAPEISYASRRDPGGPVLEFREMVKQLHRAGIEVILDVVFNHTGEGNERGPTVSFRGLDNSVYYMLDSNRGYRNYSGCGNTVNCNHPVVKQFILDSLRYWLVEMHVDGFRFDLATILGRGRSGEWIGDLSLLYDIGGDPVLRGCKLIAESWDAEGMYKVGGFPTGWAEWNGRFRDDVRRFVRGDCGMVPALARRIGGSRDLFAAKRNPAHSINFVTCHDGFTLRDLVSYTTKHNERNGENNADGAGENFSANYGVEGETDDPTIHQTRRRQAKNLLTVLMVARGTPMLHSGDELWRTKTGNNNTYCQDNELGWVSWASDADAEEMRRFVRLLVDLRHNHPALRRPCFVDPFGAVGPGMVRQVGSDITWHGVKQGRPDWSYHSRSLALQIHGSPPARAAGYDDEELYVMFNAWDQPLGFQLPEGHAWSRLVDTALPSPRDILEEEEALPVEGDAYPVQPQSTVILIARQ
jgi:glycogen operon protein